MATDSTLFRQETLDRLSSPENLDGLMQVTTPRGWIALLGLCGLIVIALVWSVVGWLPITVEGSGILARTGGIYDVEVNDSGVISEIAVRVGYQVEAGQVIARILQPELQQQVAFSEEQLRTMRSERERLARYYTADEVLQTESLNQEARQIQERIGGLEEQITWLEGRTAAQQQALDLGLITPEALQRSRQELKTVQGDLAGAHIQLQDIEVRRQSLSNRAKQDLDALDSRILETEGRLSELQLELERSSNVVSPYNGIIREIIFDPGQIIEEGASLVSLELQDVPMVVITFIPNVGNKVNVGMSARIVPATVKQAEHGYIHGHVISVSLIPSTRAGMMRLLHNDLLVEALVSKGAPFMVEIAPEADSTTTSGYRWSSGAGPQMQIPSGTLCDVNVVIERQRPISLLLPFLRSTVGM
jgi:HlyD family secretion protein